MIICERQVLKAYFVAPATLDKSKTINNYRPDGAIIIAKDGESGSQIKGAIKRASDLLDNERYGVYVTLGRNESVSRKSGREAYSAVLQYENSYWGWAEWDDRWGWGTALSGATWKAIASGEKPFHFWHAPEVVNLLLEILTADNLNYQDVLPSGSPKPVKK